MRVEPRAVAGSNLPTAPVQELVDPGVRASHLDHGLSCSALRRLQIADFMKDWRGDRIEAARRGDNPTVLRRLRSGWVVIGDHQRLPGYCLLLHDGEADHLTDLPRPDRAVFLEDLALLGEAVMIACARLDPQLWRVNYEVLGNSYPHLHGHVFPATSGNQKNCAADRSGGTRTCTILATSLAPSTSGYASPSSTP